MLCAQVYEQKTYFMLEIYKGSSKQLTENVYAQKTRRGFQKCFAPRQQQQQQQQTIF